MRTLVLVALVSACSTVPATTPGDDDDDTIGPPDGTVVPGDPPPTESPHLALGVPADATPDDDFLIVHPEMAIGYSQFLNAANWVSWRTRGVDFGPVERY